MKNNTIEQEIRRRTESFAAELRDLIRHSVLDSIHGTLGAATPTLSRGAAASAAPRSVGRGPRGRGPSGATSAAVSDFISKNPGSRLEQIAKGLGVTTLKLKKAVAGMLASGELTKTGEKRGTQYHPGKATASADGAPGVPEKASGRRGKRKVSRKARKGTTKRAPRG